MEPISTKIEIAVLRRVATCTSGVYVGSNTLHYVNFTFDEEWSESDVKTMIVIYGDKKQEVVFTGHVAEFPKVDGYTFYGVGVYAGDLRTSTAAIVNGELSALAGQPEHDDPPEDVYDQLVELASAAEAKAQSVVDAAARGDFDGAPGPQGPKGDKGDPGWTKPYLSLDRLRSYAYRVTFGDLPEETGIDSPGAGCSSYVMGGKLYRNLDWDYSELATFWVRFGGVEGMAFLPGLTDSALDDDLISQLPYHLVDGRNDAGIMVSEHVLYNDWDWAGTGDTPLYKLPYLILSRVKTMADFPAQVADILADVYATPTLTAGDYLLQFLVTDGTTTYAIMPPESASGSYVAVDISANPKLTNFRWVADETVDRGDLQERPTGVERWNMMPCPLVNLRFTAAYETPDRLSEFIGIDGTTKYSTDAELEAIYDRAHAAYQTRTRDGATWQTMHSVVYSADGVEDLSVQEDFAQTLACGVVSSVNGKTGASITLSAADVGAMPAGQLATSSTVGGIKADPATEDMTQAAGIGEDGKLYVQSTDVSDKLTEPSSGLAVGKYFRIASIDADGHVVLETVFIYDPETDTELTISLPRTGTYADPSDAMTITFGEGDMTGLELIDWGDGTVSGPTTLSHLYTAEGTYKIHLRGVTVLGNDFMKNFYCVDGMKLSHIVTKVLAAYHGNTYRHSYTTYWDEFRIPKNVVEMPDFIGRLRVHRLVYEPGCTQTFFANMGNWSVADNVILPEGITTANEYSLAFNRKCTVTIPKSMRNLEYASLTYANSVIFTSDSPPANITAGFMNYANNDDFRIIAPYGHLKAYKEKFVGPQITPNTVVEGPPPYIDRRYTMDAVAVAGAEYYLGEQSAVSITLPTDAEVGQRISVVFYSGATAATLSITGDILWEPYTPTANSRSEIHALWDGDYWSVRTSEMPVT